MNTPNNVVFKPSLVDISATWLMVEILIYMKIVNKYVVECVNFFGICQFTMTPQYAIEEKYLYW